MGIKSLKQKYKEATFEDIVVKIVTPLLAEIFATAIHTFWGCMASLTSHPLAIASLNRTISPEEMASDYVISALAPAFQAGFAVWIIISLFWNICVIHFNPAISTALLISGELNSWLYLPYVAMQLLGSTLGAAMALAIKANDNIGPFLIPDDADISAILSYEIIVTGIMCIFTNIMVGDKGYNQTTGAFAIGMTVFQGVLAGRWIGAGVMNPARAIGPVIVLGGSAWSHQWVWWVGDILGAIIFALIYRTFFAIPDKVWLAKVKKILPKKSTERESRRDESELDDPLEKVIALTQSGQLQTDMGGKSSKHIEKFGVERPSIASLNSEPIKEDIELDIIPESATTIPQAGHLPDDIERRASPHNP